MISSASAVMALCSYVLSSSFTKLDSSNIDRGLKLIAVSLHVHKIGCLRTKICGADCDIFCDAV
jgi:hypothetical protein